MADRLHCGARGAKWRYSLPETDNISTARSASPLVFRLSTPHHDDESSQTSGLDKNNDLQSGGKKRKISSDSKLIQKKRREKKKTKWVWSDDMVEEMLKFVREYKSTCDFQGIDFEADLQSLHTEVRRCMANLYPDEFGTPSLTETETSIKDMGKEEYESFKSKTDEEKLAIKKGYDRVKEKIKNIRQDYQTAVNKGSRSGSGKIVKENFDLLNEIWGGSPATSTIPFGIDGDLMEESVQDENDSEVQGILESSHSPSPSFFGDDDGDDETDNLSSVSQKSVEESRCSEDNSSKPKAKGKAIVNTAKIAQLVDNKRKHMERNLSQAQRDKILMSTAKDEVAMKKNLLDAFAQSNKIFEASMTKMTDCLTSLGSGIASAMQMVAVALSGQPKSFPLNHGQYMEAPTPAMFGSAVSTNYSNSHPSSDHLYHGAGIHSPQFSYEAGSFQADTHYSSVSQRASSVTCSHTENSGSDSHQDYHYENL